MTTELDSEVDDIFFQDVFVPTQSQEASVQPEKKSPPPPPETQSQRPESAPSTLPLQLSANTESVSAPLTSQHAEEDSQATQIEELEEPPGVHNGAPAASQTATGSKDSASTESSQHRSERAEETASSLSQTTSLNVQNVNVEDRRRGGEEASSAAVVSCSQPKLDSSDLTVNSCVQETPSNATPCSSASQSMICQTSAVDVVTSRVSRGGDAAASRPVDSSSQKCDVKDAMEESEQGEADEEEEEVMEEESAVGGGASGMALLLSQSQLLSPEPMEEESGDGGEDSVVVVADSERDATPQEKTNGSQPIRGPDSATTNGHESPVQAKEVDVASEGAGPEPEGLKDRSLSDSSGGKTGFVCVKRDLGVGVGGVGPNPSGGVGR